MASPHLASVWFLAPTKFAVLLTKQKKTVKVWFWSRKRAKHMNFGQNNSHLILRIWGFYGNHHTSCIQNAEQQKTSFIKLSKALRKTQFLKFSLAFVNSRKHFFTPLEATRRQRSWNIVNLDMEMRWESRICSHAATFKFFRLIKFLCISQPVPFVASEYFTLINVVQTFALTRPIESRAFDLLKTGSIFFFWTRDPTSQYSNRLSIKPTKRTDGPVWWYPCLKFANYWKNCEINR